jgi:hypothetical protein
MPSLYGNTSTTYTVTASNVSTLYFGSTSTAITATTYSTNLAGLYGGSYAALPTNAQQLIQLFDNSGNVDFFLNPLTNSSTIFANFMGTASITVGNFQLAGNTITNVVNGPINLFTSGDTWTFNTDGSTSFPNYTFPAAGGTAGQVLADDGTGDLYWTTINAGVTDLSAGTGIAISTSTGSITITNIGVVALTASTTSGIAVSANTGSIAIINTGVKSITAGTSTYVSTSTGDIVIWTDPPAPPLSTAFDLGTILAPVSYTLDMGPIIV